MKLIAVALAFVAGCGESKKEQQDPEAERAKKLLDSLTPEQRAELERVAKGGKPKTEPTPSADDVLSDPDVKKMIDALSPDERAKFYADVEAKKRKDARMKEMFGESEDKVAKLTVDRYASDFKAWREKNPTATCTIAEVMKFTGRDPATDGIDPWGTPYRLDCGMQIVDSAGPDKTHGTSDDISSEKRSR